MKFFRNIPIKQKVILVVLLANVVTLLLSLLAVFTFQWFHIREMITDDLRSQGEVLAASSTAALTFNDPETAAETLAPLKDRPHVLAAALYLPDRSCLASFGDVLPEFGQHDPVYQQGFHHEGRYLVLEQAVMLKTRNVGTLFLRFDFRAMETDGSRSYLIVIGLILPMSLLLALLLSSSLHRVISLPIEQLAATARQVTDRKHYTLRAQQLGTDEVGALTQAFNQMLARIQDQDLALLTSETRYRLLFDSNPIPMYVVENTTLRFLAANDATVMRYGYTREDLLQMTAKEIRPAIEIDRLVESAASLTPLNHAGEWRHQTKDGRLIDVDVTTHAIEFDGHPARMVLAVDITERKKVEAAWHHRLNMEKLIGEISAHFINLPAAKIDEGIRWALGMVGQSKNLDLSWVSLFSADGQVANCAHQWSEPGLEPRPSWPRMIECHQLSWWTDRIKKSTPVRLNHPGEWPAEASRESKLLTELQIRSVVAVPLVFHGIAIGFLGVARRRDGKTWGDESLTVLELVAQTIVSALERKRAGEELETIHSQLVTASHQAGMAEVATGVLHNVGNVLNSVNVSTTLLQETLRKSEMATLAKVAKIVEDHAGHLPVFLSEDPRGKALPGLIVQLSDELGREHNQLERELFVVARNIEHIKEIVAMQQNYAKISGLLEEVSLAGLIDDAVSINHAGLGRHGVNVRRDYQQIPLVLADKHKVLQILINLIHNAKYALDDANRPDKLITLGLSAVNGTCVKVTVQDNGVGIPRENLARIFSLGFTTRSRGHGFGLHSGANAAREMGGTLSAASDGPGLGATFTLELPVKGKTKSL